MRRTPAISAGGPAFRSEAFAIPDRSRKSHRRAKAAAPVQTFAMGKARTPVNPCAGAARTPAGAAATGAPRAARLKAAGDTAAA